MLTNRIMAAMASLGAFAAPVLAQDVDKAPDHATWVGGLLVIMLVVLTVLVSIKSAKRGHQD